MKSTLVLNNKNKFTQQEVREADVDYEPIHGPEKF